MLQSQSSTAEQSFPLSREEVSSLRYVSTSGLWACLSESQNPLHRLGSSPRAEGQAGSCCLCHGNRACE